MAIKEDEEHEYKPTNRETSQRPKAGRYWCNYCDASLVGHGEKCGNCKHRDKTKKFKKGT